MRTIGFGIIGIGRQGLRLAEHIRKDIDHAKLIAICRRSDSGHEYSREHGIKFYSDHNDLLADREVDAVIITTPSGLHGSQAIDALKAGKHLLIDKPIASTVAEGEEIMALANDRQLTVAVNFPLRINPVTEALKSNLSSIGVLKKIQVTVSHGPTRSEWQSNINLSKGGVIMDLGSHYFDLLSFLTGTRPERINSAYSEKSDNEHSGFIELAYNDFSVSLVLIRNQKLNKNIVTCAGEKGFVFSDYAMREVIVSTSHEINEIKCPATYDFNIMLNNFVRAVNNKEKVIADAKAGLHSLQIALSVYKAIESAGSVRL